jgi:hypothetical protein
MIVSFTIDPEVFETYEAQDPINHHAHLRLQEAWHLWGTLHLPVERDARRRWLKSLRALPMPLRKRWQTGLMHNRWRFSDDADLHCVTRQRAAEAGVAAPRVSIQKAEGPEICRFDCADQALSMTRARVEAHQGIPSGMVVQEAWERKFQRLVARARHVVLVDRYALFSHLDKRRPAPSGLSRLMQELDSLPGPVTLTLYTLKAAGWARSLQGLADTLTHGGLREWRVRLANEEIFARHAHDRHLRIDRTLIQLGKGIEILAGTEVYAASDFDLKAFSPFARDREETLRRVCEETRWMRREPGSPLQKIT